MKEKLTSAISYINKFVQSDWFILFNALLIFIGWVSNAWVPLLCIAVVISIVPLFLSKETKHLLSLIMMFTFIISSNRHALNSYAPLLALIPVMLAGVIFNLVRFRRGRQNWEFMHPTKIKGFHCTLIALIIPFAFGGVGSPYEHPLAVLAALGLVIIMAFVYTFMMATNLDSEQKSKLPEYLLKILFISGLLVSLQLVIYFARLGGIEQIKEAILQKNINIGWAGKNNVAPILSMCIPAGFYFSIKKSKLSPLFIIVALLEYALIFVTNCRGAILFTTLAMPAMLLYTIVKSENKVSFGITVCLAFAIAIFFVAYFGEFVADLVNNIIGKGLDSAGRVESLYPLAWETFKQWPFFGAGWDYKLGGFASSNYTPFWYHSTALQILVTMGVVGVITFAFFYFWRYRTLLLHRKNPAYVALLAGLLLFDLYGMIDTNFFGPTFFAMLLCISFVADINLPDDKCRAFGGRNPFLDIANGCKWIISSIKAKTAMKKATVGETVSTDENTVKPETEITDESATEIADAPVDALLNNPTLDSETNLNGKIGDTDVEPVEK